MGEELVAQALAAAGARDEAGDVHELNGRRDGFLRVGKLAQHAQPRVGHGDDAVVRVNRTERVVRRLRLAGAGDGVEEGGLPDVGESDDSSA